MNIVEIEEAFESLAKKPFDAREFPFLLAEAVGTSPTNVARLRRGTANRSDIEGGTLLSGKFHFVTASPDSLTEALERTAGSAASKSRKVRLAVVTDGVRIAGRDLKTGDVLHCGYDEIADNFSFFLPLADYERFSAAEENIVDIRATGRLTRLYDAIIRQNPDWGRPARRHEMNQFMTRIVFCLFAEDTGILSDDLFTRTITNFGGRNGENVQKILEDMFVAMATPVESRKRRSLWTDEFPYVNGGLFEGVLSVPSFNRTTFDYLKESGSLDWAEINPDIFGSMIQSIADPRQRAELGMHYTSVPNILRVIGPLFLDDLDISIEKYFDNAKGLRRILERIEHIRVFDPACGSGNFLVVSYRELRDREIRILRRLRELEGRGQMALFSRISLSNFFGIEISDFAAETAKLSLHIAEYQANRRFADAFGRVEASLPLRQGGQITTGNALRIDWDDVCPPPEGRDDEAFRTCVAGRS